MPEGRSRASLLKIAALLHDVAKPADADDRRRRAVRSFFGHADAGADDGATVMRRLRFSAAEVQFVSTLVAEHLRPVQLAQVGEAPTRRALYRFYRDLGDAARGGVAARRWRMRRRRAARRDDGRKGWSQTRRRI